jgi:hypothetical protein
MGFIAGLPSFCFFLWGIKKKEKSINSKRAFILSTLFCAFNLIIFVIIGGLSFSGALNNISNEPISALFLIPFILGILFVITFVVLAIMTGRYWFLSVEPNIVRFGFPKYQIRNISKIEVSEKYILVYLGDKKRAIKYLISSKCADFLMENFETLTHYLKRNYDNKTTNVWEREQTNDGERKQRENSQSSSNGYQYNNKNNSSYKQQTSESNDWMWKRIEEEMRIRVENETKAKLEVEAAYKLFDLSPNASVDEITKRYKELAWEFHPDKRKSDNNIDWMRKINAAYEIIKRDKNF